MQMDSTYFLLGGTIRRILYFFDKIQSEVVRFTVRTDRSESYGNTSLFSWRLNSTLSAFGGLVEIFKLA